MPRINTDNLTRSVNTLQLAFDSLRKQEPEELIYDVYRGACMNEFQVVIELSASLLRRRLRPYFATVRQVNDLTFAQVFREAARLHLISLNECRKWLNYRDHHNTIAHGYGREFAEEALTMLPPLIEDARGIADMIGAETDE